MFLVYLDILVRFLSMPYPSMEQLDLQDERRVYHIHLSISHWWYLLMKSEKQPSHCHVFILTYIYWLTLGKSILHRYWCLFLLLPKYNAYNCTECTMHHKHCYFWQKVSHPSALSVRKAHVSWPFCQKARHPSALSLRKAQGAGLSARKPVTPVPFLSEMPMVLAFLPESLSP